MNAAGVDRRYTVYATGEAHSSIEKAVRIAGLGTDNLRRVDVDPDTLAMRADSLAALLAADRAAGAVPTMVAATIGTTSTTAIDPLEDLGAVCRAEDVWLHVDAAYAGAAAACPELRWTHAGVELADSYCTDPHKWLLTNFDCDALWVADRGALLGALSILPEYLRNAATESGAVVDYRDWQVPLGRRFRALKLWFVLRWYGAEGVRAFLREHVALAAEFAGWVAEDDRFEVVGPHPFGLVCFRLTDPACGGRDAADAANAALVGRLNASGALFLTHTRVHGAYTLRLAIGATSTRRHHVEAAWDRIRAEAGALLEDRRTGSPAGQPA